MDIFIILMKLKNLKLQKNRTISGYRGGVALKKYIVLFLVCFLLGMALSIANANDKVAEISQLVSSYNSQAESDKIAQAVYQYSAKYEVDRRLVLAIAIQESDFRQIVVGQAQEIGIMQIKPTTGKQVSGEELLSLYDIKENIKAGVKYLRLCQQIMREYANDYVHLLELTATAYNRGPWRTINLLEKGVDPRNSYAAEVMGIRHRILTGNL